MARVILTVFGALLAPWLAGCGPADEAQAAAPGVTSKAASEETGVFVPWDGEASVQREIERLTAAGGGELRFAPGEYLLEVGFEIPDARGIRVSGAPGAILRFAPAPDARATLAADVNVGDTSLTLEGAALIVPGRRYQLYPASLEGDRILEWTALAVDGESVTLERPVAFMGHVTSIPKGSVVVPELNAFRVQRSSDLSFEGLIIDGGGRGDVRGHTTFCGIYVVGNPPGRNIPRLGGLTIRDCTMSGLTGRAICIYRMEDVRVEGCTVRDIRTEGIELDHFTSGRVTGCEVDGAGVGIVLNDAFDSVVEHNVVSRCQVGIAMIKHFTHPHVNRGLVVQDNVLRDNVSHGISVRPGIVGNVVRRNRFAGTPVERWILGGEGNELESNEALELEGAESLPANSSAR